MGKKDMTSDGVTTARSVSSTASDDETGGPGSPAPHVALVDQIFATPKAHTEDFEFGAETAAVFDDMVSRSVPFYGEIQNMVCDLASDFAVAGSGLCDLGCSTGTTLLALHDRVDPAVRFVGVDNSDDMLEKARIKLAPLDGQREVDLVNADLNNCRSVEDSSVAIMLLTLQFVRPLYRERLLRHVFEGLRDNSCLIVVEKITGSDTLLNRLFIEHYYDYKRRKGYSDLEISQKREALENVLIPYHYEENRDLLRDVGFRHVEEFFRYYNFCGLIAVT
jgi:tRNA (cmo5U34)-methyltransferase